MQSEQCQQRGSSGIRVRLAAPSTLAYASTLFIRTTYSTGEGSAFSKLSHVKCRNRAVPSLLHRVPYVQGESVALILAKQSLGDDETPSEDGKSRTYRPAGPVPLYSVWCQQSGGPEDV